MNVWFASTSYNFAYDLISNYVINNIDIRMEEFVYQKLDRRLRDRTTTHSELGAALADAGNAYGPQTTYGKVLTVRNFSNVIVFYR